MIPDVACLLNTADSTMWKLAQINACTFRNLYRWTSVCPSSLAKCWSFISNTEAGEIGCHVQALNHLCWQPIVFKQTWATWHTFLLTCCDVGNIKVVDKPISANNFTLTVIRSSAKINALKLTLMNKIQNSVSCEYVGAPFRVDEWKKNTIWKLEHQGVWTM